MLRHIPLLRHISAARLKRLLAASRIEHYRKDAVLFRQDERAAAIWLLFKGWVHLVRSPDARNGSHAVVVFTITPDEVLCGISAIESGAYQVSGIAGTECQALRVPSATLNEALQHEAAFAYHALVLCARRLQHITLQYGGMAEPVALRLIRTILRLRQQFGTTLPVTHRELAQMSWTTTESAIRIVRRLKQHGYVSGTRGRLTVTRAQALSEMLERTDGTAVV